MRFGDLENMLCNSYRITATKKEDIPLSCIRWVVLIVVVGPLTLFVLLLSLSIFGFFLDMSQVPFIYLALVGSIIMVVVFTVLMEMLNRFLFPKKRKVAEIRKEQFVDPHYF